MCTPLSADASLHQAVLCPGPSHAVLPAGDNSVDLLTNDVGLVVMCSPTGELEGFDVLVGGGMGRTHR